MRESRLYGSVRGRSEMTVPTAISRTARKPREISTGSILVARARPRSRSQQQERPVSSRTYCKRVQ
jgi:hypothetical protein